MKLILGIKDFGIWLKKDKYFITNNRIADVVIKRGYAKFILEITQEDLGMMLADFHFNGVPKDVVKYFVNKLK